MSQSSLQRAIHLVELRQFERAEAELRRYLAENPSDDDAHFHLAHCLLLDGKRHTEALGEIRAAIGLAPESAMHHALHSSILLALDRNKEALAAANEALRQDPASSFAWFMKARILFRLHDLDGAESAIHSALEVNPDDEDALGLLSAILQQAGKVDSGIEAAQKMLARDADNAWGHVNLGWAKLRQNNPREAEEHFREALRLEPGMEYARMGLLESFKARSPLYRLYLKWAFWMGKFAGGQQFLIILGIFVIYKLFRSAAEQIHPLLVAAVVLAWFMVVFGSHLAGAFGHLLITLDRTARLSLTRAEKIDGLFTGGLFVSGLAITILGYVVLPGIWIGGGMLLIAASLPAAHVLLNPSKTGRLVFGGFVLAALVGFATVAHLAITAPDAKAPTWTFYTILLCLLSTWLTSVPALRRNG
jgi:tetratricopeptide (TPR) repeat protein